MRSNLDIPMNHIEAQRRAAACYRDAEAWTRMSIYNTAASGRFSTDRTISDYNRDIWRLTPVPVKEKTK